MSNLFNSKNIDILSHSVNNLKFYYKNFFICSTVSLFLWALYLQFSPKIGNIWIRDDSEGNRIFVPVNILNMIYHSISRITFWYPSNWDLNVFIWIFSGNGLFFLYKYYV